MLKGKRLLLAIIAGCILIPLLLIPGTLIRDIAANYIIAKARSSGVIVGIEELGLGFKAITAKKVSFTVRSSPIAGEISNLELQPSYSDLLSGKLSFAIAGEIFSSQLALIASTSLFGDSTSLSGSLKGLKVGSVPQLALAELESGEISIDNLKFFKSDQNIEFSGIASISNLVKPRDTTITLKNTLIFIPSFDVSKATLPFNSDSSHIRLNQGEIVSSYGNLNGDLTLDRGNNDRVLCETQFTPSTVFEGRFASLLPLMLQGDTKKRPLNISCAGDIKRITLISK